MWVWLVILLALVLMLLLALASNLTVQLYYHKHQDDDRALVSVSAFYGLVKYRLDIPAIMFHPLVGFNLMLEKINDRRDDVLSESGVQINREKVSRLVQKGKELLHDTIDLKPWIRETLAKFVCTKLQWDTRIGLGDAPETAVTVGILWSLKSVFLAVLSHFVRLEAHPRMMVTPQYNQHHFSTELSMTARIRIGQILWSMLKLAVRIRPARHGRKQARRQTRMAKQGG